MVAPPELPLAAAIPMKASDGMATVRLPTWVHAPGLPFTSGAVSPLKVLPLRVSRTQQGKAPLPELLVLAAAEAIQTHVKTLDAIHLGSVIAAGLDATIVSHDTAMIAAATWLGYPTFDPVTES